MNISQQDIKFLRESFLFEEFEKICFPKELKKQAGLWEDLQMSSVGSAIKSFAERHIKDSSETPGGYITSIIHVLSPAVLFRINPILGAIYLALDIFGFNISDMAIRLAKALELPLEENGSLLPSEVNSIAASVFGGLGDTSPAKDGLYRSAEDNTLSEIVFEQLIKEACLISQLDQQEKNSLLKEAGWQDEVDKYYKKQYYGEKGPATPFLRGGGKEVPIIQRIFGNIFNRPNGASRLRWFGVGIVVWLLKTLLAGAGLLAVGSMVGSLIGAPKKGPSLKEDKSSSKEKSSGKEDSEDKESSTTPEALKQKSTSGVRLEVALQGNGSFEDTVRSWVLEYYMDELYNDILSKKFSPTQMFEVEAAITKAMRSPGSKAREYVRMLQLYKENNKGSFNEESNRFLMPEKYTSRLQFVNEFIDDIKDKLKAQLQKS